MNFIKRLPQLFKKLKEEIVYTFTKSLSIEQLSEAEKMLYSVNSRKWGRNNNISKKSYILIEGILSEYGPNYLYRTALLTKAIQSKYPDLTPVVIYTSLLHMNKRATAIYQSFQIKHFVSTANSLINQCLKPYCKLHAYFITKKIKNGEQLLNFKYDEVHVGDLIYDNITSTLKKYKTIEEIKPDMKPFIFQAIYEIIIYKRLFKKYRPVFFVSTHPCYITYGILCRLALKHGSRVILTTDIEVVELKKNLDPKIKWTPVFHEFVGDYIKEKLKKSSDDNTLVEQSKKYLEERIKGNLDQVDVQLAYKSKKEYEEENLRTILGLDSKKPIVFIFAHIIADVPHCSHFLLFRDYYVWLIETLRICSNVEDVYWLVKPHPAAKVYMEEGLVEDAVANINKSHIKIVPHDYNTNSALKYAHALVTINGTAGLEFSCFGVPVILAGRPFYSEQGICYEPTSIEEYTSILEGIKNIKSLGKIETEKALKILGAFNTYSISNNMVLTSEILMHIWGYKERDLELVYQKMAENLDKIDPRLEPQYLRMVEILNY